MYFEYHFNTQFMCMVLLDYFDSWHLLVFYQNPLPEVPIPSADSTTEGEGVKNGNLSENVQDTDKVKSNEVTKNEENKKSDKKTDSEKSDNSSDKTKQTQESNNAENSQSTESAASSQSTEPGGQEQKMDTSEKVPKNGKREPTPSRVSPSSMLGLAGKPDKTLAGDRVNYILLTWVFGNLFFLNSAQWILKKSVYEGQGRDSCPSYFCMKLTCFTGSWVLEYCCTQGDFHCDSLQNHLFMVLIWLNKRM